MFNIGITSFLFSVMLEAMKCLSNIIFNCPCAQVLSTKTRSLEGIVVRLQACKNPDVPHDIKVITMKILFLITARGEDVAPQLKSELMMYLIDILDIILKEAGETVGDEKRAVSSDMKITVSVSMLHVPTFGQILCVSFTLAVAVLNLFSPI